MMNRTAPENIGFGTVLRRFNSEGRIFLAGEELSRDFLLRMPAANRDAMEDSRQIKIYPRAVSRRSAAATIEVGGEYFLRATGVDEYDVIVGAIVGSKLTKDAAQALIDTKTAQPAENAPAGSTEAAIDAPKRLKKVPGKRNSKRKTKSKRKSATRAAAPKPPKAEPPKAEPGPSDQNGPID